MTALIKEYESQKYIGFHEILDFHVKFERIRAQFASTDCPFRMNGAGSSVEAV